MSLAFLERGIHVILEQPIHHDDLKQCFKAAQKNKCCFMTGDLYLNMPEIRRFMQVTSFLKSRGEKIEYIKAGSCVQAFYPFVEILLQLVPSSDVEINYVSEQMGDFKQILGKIGNIPCSFEFNNAMNPKDPDNHMQILHNFCCYYHSGRLELTDTRGPLIWYPRMNMPWSLLDGGGFPEKYPDYMMVSGLDILTQDINELTKPYYQFAEDSWISCISMDLDKIKEMSTNKSKFLIKAQQEQKASRLWNELTHKFGYASLDSCLVPKPMTSVNLKEKSILPEERNKN